MTGLIGLARLTRRAATLAIVCALGLASPQLHAAEIYSNGLGGGAWSDPSAWRGGKTPAPEDDVTIARGDVITFDRNDDEKASANKLFIDPDGTLAFKTASGKITLSLADAVEVYGRIQMDAARVHGDVLEIRMVGLMPEQRAITLMRGGSITLAGQRFLNPDQASAILSSRPENAPFTHESGRLTITCQGQAAIDLRNTLFQAVEISLREIDNTNAFPGQRLNIVGNTFLGRSSVSIVLCDTPIVADNTFTNPTERAIDMAIVTVNNCPLPTVRNNNFNAKVRDAISCAYSSDALIQNNVIRNATRGVIIQYSNNVMVQDNKLFNCDTGFYMRVRSGVLRNNHVDGGLTPHQAVHSSHQMINETIANLLPERHILSNNASTVILFNTAITADKVNQLAGSGPERVVSHLPMIVHVKGNVPRGSVVEVTPVETDLQLTTEYPPVVNSPASIDSQGLTPTMATNRAILVRSWLSERADGDVQLTPSPTYRVRVLAPAASGNPDERRELASQTIKPSDAWFRADQNDRTPSMEITLP